MSELLSLIEKQNKTNHKTNKPPPNLEFLLIRNENPEEKKWPEESFWSDSGDSDLNFAFNLSCILPGLGKEVNFERTYDTRAAAEMMNELLLLILCGLLSLRMSTGHKGPQGQNIWRCLDSKNLNARSCWIQATPTSGQGLCN